MRKAMYHHCKCACPRRNPQTWTVIREYRNVCVLFCSECEHAWYTTPSVGESFQKRLVSEYRWQQIKALPGFHARENVDPMEDETQTRTRTGETTW